jgi:hypothetical protein
MPRGTKVLEIPLTTFIDFVLKSGTPRLTAVRNAKKDRDEGYGPFKDFYRAMREAIVEYHRTGDISNLEEASTPSDAKKADAYELLAAQYKSFALAKKFTWLQKAPKLNWTGPGDFVVNVNPELALASKGTRYLIKLYFKEEPELEKTRADVILHLMALALASGGPQTERFVCAVVDIRRKKWFTGDRVLKDLTVLVEGEAAAFLHMYRSLAA